MMRNDTIGDCTCAAAGHLIQCWSTNAGAPTVPTDDQVVVAYSAITGYDPATGTNDNGAAELDVLNYWRHTGIAGNKLSSYVAVDPTRPQEVCDAIWLFGGVYLGLEMPESAEQQTAAGRPWTTVWYSPIIGGQAVPAVGYDPQYLKVITWGQVQLVGWEFLARRCDEAYALLNSDWISSRGTSPSGFDLKTLESDLASLRN
jgi:hypothetical protein